VSVWATHLFEGEGKLPTAHVGRYTSFINSERLILNPAAIR
jgi:hypothetical protein